MSQDNIPEHFRQRIQAAREQQLEELDLSAGWGSREKLSQIPNAVFELKHLKVLNLNFNRIYTLPDSFSNLSNLVTLDLRGNRLINLPDSFGNLSSLTTLNLRENQLAELPESIGNLSSLTTLNLRENQLAKLPEFIGNLSSLTKLVLSNNQLSELPNSFSRLPSLNTLYLAGNELTSLPDSFSSISNLRELYLSRNKLVALPNSFSNLSNLITLILSNNKLSELPISFSSLSNLATLDLTENPLEKPPIEIAKKGIEAIRKYFLQITEKGKYYIYEAKLLIVGEPGAGKTTLSKKIKNPSYPLDNNEKTTEGLDVIKWSFQLDHQQEFRVNIWDFGGQEIYHATHQFFLTKRSLYTLVVDTRQEDTDFYYWLKIVELLSNNSPLLIIKNEKQDRKREINERALRGQFTNLKETLATNLKTNRGLEQVITNIKYYISNLDHIGQALPKTWVQVRKFLENDSRNYIFIQEYLTICENNGFTRLEDKLQLSGYLHDLGVCLHFQDDSLLKKTIILKPEWGTDAVYKVLDNDTVRQNLGRFTKTDLADIWSDDKYSHVQDELLQLMIKFKLCYPIPGNNNTYIAPQLLTENQPQYNWDEHSNLILRYTYQFMPKGIITQLIVAMHKHIYQQKYVWRSGIILKKNNALAEVIEYYSKRELKIRVVGNNKRDLMTIITHEIDKIHDSYQQLKYSKLIPCNCSICQYSQEPYFYPFDELQRFKNHRQFEIQCRNSFQMVNVLSLIDDVIIGSNNTQEEGDNNDLSNSHQSLFSVIINNPKQQQGNNNNMSDTNQTHYGSGDNVGRDKNTTNIYNSQNLAQASRDIKELLNQLALDYPSQTPVEQMMLSTEILKKIENNPSLKQRVINAIKEAGATVLEEAIDHPAAKVIIAGIKGYVDA